MISLFSDFLLMKVIWLIGGMSRESSIEYYRIINEETKKKLRSLHSSKSLMYSVDFDEIEHLQHQWKWNELKTIMIDAAKRLEQWGADMVVICTNTMHKMADDVANAVSIPLLHIADATAQRILKQGYKKVWLLGTKFTMEEDFYKGRLMKKYWLDVVVPSELEREIVHHVIYDELCQWIIQESSKKQYLEIINNLVTSWVEAIILWCTEIPLLVKQEDVHVPLFDTTRIHAEGAVEEALK